MQHWTNTALVILSCWYHFWCCACVQKSRKCFYFVCKRVSSKD